MTDRHRGGLTPTSVFTLAAGIRGPQAAAPVVAAVLQAVRPRISQAWVDLWFDIPPKNVPETVRAAAWLLLEQERGLRRTGKRTQMGIDIALHDPDQWQSFVAVCSWTIGAECWSGNEPVALLHDAADSVEFHLTDPELAALGDAAGLAPA